NISGGLPALHAEVSLGAPQDVGEAKRRRGFDPVMRVEGYYRGLIVGASHIRSHPYDRRAFVRGDLAFSGFDLRYMHEGFQVRGEMINGRPFNNTNTNGWYVDGLVHRRELGPVTIVGRVEKLDYDAGRFSQYYKRYTVGSRVSLPYYL